MRSRVVEQVESERRAALAAGRRRIEREVAHQVAGAQGTMLAQQQVGLWSALASCEGLVPILCNT